MSDYRTALLTVPCPDCGADVSQDCRDYYRRAAEPHLLRHDAHTDAWLQSIGYLPLGTTDRRRKLRAVK